MTSFCILTASLCSPICCNSAVCSCVYTVEVNRFVGSTDASHSCRRRCASCIVGLRETVGPVNGYGDDLKAADRKFSGERRYSSTFLGLLGVTGVLGAISVVAMGVVLTLA